MSSLSEQEQSRRDQDRRSGPRFNGDGLIANVAGSLVKVADISLTGIKVKIILPIGPEPLAVTLYPRDGNKVDLNQGIRVKCIAVRSDGEETGLKFQRSTMALSRLIIRLMSGQLGVDPYFVK